jgi:chondroitin-sulfate-ABC endolyase/exolyase
LGSNINSDNKEYDVQTNLYQKALKTEKYPTFVDGKEITAFPVMDEMLDSKDEHHLIDSVGNGYFIPAGQKAFVARKHQKSRTMIYFKATDHEGDFATAWLEHGVACKDAKYSYVVMPYCNKKEFAKFSSNDYEILQQDKFAHILHDKIDGFYAGIFFKGGDVDNLPHVSNVERDCQIMYKTTNGNSVSKLEIAVGDPDTHRHWTTNAGAGRHGGKSKLTPLKITFKEAWKLEKDVEGVKIINSNNNKTVIEFACIHGKDFNFTLIK